jgi:hypothetical protein
VAVLRVVSMAPDGTLSPWIGKGYENARLKILLLGEVHYWDKRRERCPSYTIDLVCDHISGKGVRFLTKVTRLIPLESLPTGGRKAFWNEISYSNFIPHIVGSSARGEKPTSEDYSIGRRRYKSVLDRIRPEVVFVCGFRLWDEMGLSPPEEASGRRAAKLHGVDHFGCMHPSTSLTYEEWRGRFAAFLGKERKRRLDAMRRIWVNA